MWRCCNRNNPGRCLMTEDLLTRNVNYTFTSEENSRAPLAVWNAACCIFTTLKISKLYFWNIPKKRDWDGFICVRGNNKLFSECALANAWDESNKVKRRLATVRRLSPCGYYITGSWSVVTGFRMTYVRLQCRLILWDCFFFFVVFFLLLDGLRAGCRSAHARMCVTEYDTFLYKDIPHRVSCSSGPHYRPRSHPENCLDKLWRRTRTSLWVISALSLKGNAEFWGSVYFWSAFNLRV